MGKTKSYAHMFKWQKRFSEERQNVKNDERPGRHSISGTEEYVENIKLIQKTANSVHNS